VARPESQRKALRVASRLISLGLLSAVVSFPLAFTGTIMMNPLLGRLEAKYGVELTGHSGPADWIFALVFALTAISLFAVLVLLTRRPSAAPPDNDSRKRPSATP